MLNNPVIITSGADSEYVLGGLCNFLKNEGYEIIELDFANFHNDPLPLLYQLSKRKTVYITSAHTNLTRDIANYIAPTFPSSYPNYLAPIEIIPILKPELSLFVPHDLLTPYGDENLSEIRFLDLFNHVLVPTLEDKKILEAILPTATKLHHAGWIKYPKQSTKIQPTIPRLLFISMIIHLQYFYGIGTRVKVAAMSRHIVM